MNLRLANLNDLSKLKIMYKEIIDNMSKNNINVEYLYAFITISGKHAYVVLRVEDNEKAGKILSENGVKLVNQSDIDAL